MARSTKRVKVAPLDEGGARYLFTFLGNLTSGARARIFAQPWSRPDVLVERTEPFWDKIGSAEVADFKQRYADTLLASCFVLCPRGNGTSSFRLFETMQAGRAPVILADAWTPPSHIDWSACALTIKERDIPNLPEICQANRGRAEAMGLAARREWEAWFSPLGMWRLIETAAGEIAAARPLPERAYRMAWPLRHGFLGGRAMMVQAKVGLDRLRGR